MPIGRRPGARRAAATARSVRQVERVAAFAVELVDKGDDRHVAQPTDLEELAGLLLDAPLAPLGAASISPLPLPRAGEGGVGCGRCRLRSSWAEILVARRVEQVEGKPSCSKLITAEETEMPRRHSTAIQSERTRSPRPNPFRCGTSPCLQYRNHRCGGHDCAPCSTRIISTTSARTR